MRDTAGRCSQVARRAAMRGAVRYGQLWPVGAECQEKGRIEFSFGALRRCEDRPTLPFSLRVFSQPLLVSSALAVALP